MFRYRVLHFSAQSKDRQQDNAQQWLQEWFKANSYCKSGYDILSNSYEPFPRAVFGLDPFTIGGSVVAIGKCKPLVTSAAAP